MLGVERCRQKKPEVTSSCSPLPLLEAAGLYWRRPLPISLVRSRRFEAVFRSPMTTVRLRAAIMRSLFPTCFFTPSPNFPQARSACDSFASAGLPPGVGDVNTACPFPNSRPAIPVPPRISAPLRGSFFPSGSPRSIRLITGKLAFRNDPISCCSLLSILFLAFDCRSSLRVRYCFGGWLFLKPLGTFLTMPRNVIWVKKFRELKISFHQPFFHCVSVA